MSDADMRPLLLRVNFFRVQNLIAASPGGTPIGGHGKARMHQEAETVCILKRPALSRPLLTL
jgi:hypothetical protein